MDEIIKALTNCQEDIHNKIKSTEAQIERIKGTRLEQDILDSLRYLKAVSARLAVCLDVLGGRDFILYQEGKDLILVKPDESTAKLIKKAEELGARLVEFNLEAEHQQALM
jgi:hypothetical protein